MKRRFTILFLLTFMVLLGSLAGCSTSAEEANEDFLPSTKELDPAVISFYLPGAEKKDTREVLDKVSKTADLNITLDFKWIDYNQYQSKIETELAASKNFDAFLCGRPEQGALNFAELYREKKIKDISQLFPQYAPVIFSQLSMEEVSSTKVDGSLAAVPSLLPQANCLCVLLRQDMAEKYGVSSINTFEEYTSVLKKLKEGEKDLIPGVMGGYNIDIFTRAYDYVVLDYSQYLVYKRDDPDMKIIPWEQTSEFRQSASLIDKWFKEGYISPLNGQNLNFASYLFNANTYMEGSIDLDFTGKGDKKVYQIYMLYKDKKIQRMSPIANVFQKGAVVFNSTSKNTERALMFLNWIQSSQQNYDLFVYGIKDRHYTLNGERISTPEEISGMNNPYSGWLYTAFANIDLERVPDVQTYSDTFMTDHKRFIDKNTYYAPHEGFYPDYRSIRKECDARMQIYQGKLIPPLSSGTFDIDELDGNIGELKDAGADRIVEETQKQLDDWRSKAKN